MAELRWTNEALAWLKEIHGYIAQDNPAAAAKVTTGSWPQGPATRSSPARSRPPHAFAG